MKSDIYDPKTGFSPLIYSIIILTILFIDGELSLSNAQSVQYKTGFATAVKIGADIQKVIEEKHKGAVNEIPVFLETDVMPFIKPVEYPGTN